MSQTSRTIAVLVAVWLTAAVLPARQIQTFTIQIPPGAQGQMPPPRDVQPAKTGTARIRGRVVAADTGQPLRKAIVRAAAPEIRENRSTSTDAEGRFELKDLPAGRFTVTANKGSFVSLTYGQLRPFAPGKPIDVRDGQTIDKIDFALPRGGIITGRILDEFGEPIADVLVTTMRYQFFQGRRRLVPNGRGNMTNDIGEYRIFGVPPGEYYLSATLRGISMFNDVSDDRSGYAPTYYPGTPSVAEAQRVKVVVGQTLTNVSMALLPTRTARVTGTAVDSSGKPLSGGMIMVMQREGAMVMSTSAAQIRPDGTFTISSVAPGEYTLRAQSMGGFGETPEFASARVDVAGEDIAGVQLVGMKPVSVTGRIVLAPALVPSFQPSTVRVVTSSADPDQMMLAPGGGGKINDDLTFELKVPPGKSLVRLLARTAGEWVTKSERLDGIDVTDTGIETRPGQDVAGLEIELTNQQTEVSGTVTSRGQGVKDYSVVLFARDRERWTLPQSRYVRTGQGDQDGRFKVTGLPAGDYYAVALDYIEPGESSDPDFLDRIKDRAVGFALNDGETKNLELKLSPSS